MFHNVFSVVGNRLLICCAFIVEKLLADADIEDDVQHQSNLPFTRFALVSYFYLTKFLLQSSLLEM